jgi:Zn-dependent alcohol dehydrogenase
MHEKVLMSLSFTPPHNKDIKGCLYGNVDVSHDLRMLADMVMDGRYINLSKLITKKFKLEKINDAFEAMGKRQIIGRWVCVFE